MAAKKRYAPRGRLTARMVAVMGLPKSGWPEVSSNMEPIAAIKATQEPPTYTELLGVTVKVLKGYQNVSRL